MAPRRVLVTGMSGLIGGALRRHLEGTYELSALNRRPIPGVACHEADIADLDAIAPAFKGVDTVVHLAARTGTSEVFEELLQANVVGTYNVFEAARRAGVSRVVYASSGATVSAWERDPPYSALVAGLYDAVGSWKTMTNEMPLRPAGLYGASKIWGEAIARHYADAYGLSAICVRIGRVRAEDRPSSPREFSVFCSQRDVVRMLELCITAPPELRFDIFYAVSDNKWGYRDLEHARAVLGFEPRDRAEDYRR
jgi:nucleoside-diphosphate-sugar epimerase